jgi:hypothetical protein
MESSDTARSPAADKQTGNGTAGSLPQAKRRSSKSETKSK